MSSVNHVEQKLGLKTSVPTFALLLPLLIAPAGGDEAARGAATVSQESVQAQKESPQSENREEEFRIRYKKPKQRHDDDEAPVPKFGKPPQPDSTTPESRGAQR